MSKKRSVRPSTKAQTRKPVPAVSLADLITQKINGRKVVPSINDVLGSEAATYEALRQAYVAERWTPDARKRFATSDVRYADRERLNGYIKALADGLPVDMQAFEALLRLIEERADDLLAITEDVAYEVGVRVGASFSGLGAR